MSRGGEWSQVGIVRTKVGAKMDKKGGRTKIVADGGPVHGYTH